MLKDFLIRNGLDEKEAALYLCALEHGETPISRLAQKLSIKRTTLYVTAERLKSKGILSLNKKKGISYASVIEPEALLDGFTSNNKATINACKEKLDEIEKMHEEFNTLKGSIYLRPRVRFFEGRNGIQQVLREFASSKTGSLGFTDYQQMPDELAQFIRDEIVPERKRHKNKAHFIIPNNAMNKKVQGEDKERYSNHKILNFQTSENPIELLLYEHNKIAFISFMKNELFALVIESEAIHKSIKNIFNFMWEIDNKK